MAGPSLKIESQRVGWSTGERTRRSAIRIAGGAGAIAAISALFAFPLDHAGVVVLSMAGGLTSIGAGLVALLSLRQARQRFYGEVSIQQGALTVRSGPDVRTVPLGRVREGWSLPPDVATLRLDDGEELSVGCGSLERADQLLSAAGVDPDKRTLRVPLVSPASTVPFGTTLALLGASGLGAWILFWLLMISVGTTRLFTSPDGWDGPMMVVFVVLLLVMLWLGSVLLGTLRRRSAVVGADGIRLETSRDAGFVPYTDMRAVMADPLGVRIERHAGAPMLLRTTTWRDRPLPTGDLVPGPGEVRAAMAQRVLFDRITQNATECVPPASIDALDRRGKPLAAWRQELRSLVQRGGGYRSQALPKALLHDLLENGATAPERRVAAALALADCGDEHDKQRIRVAIDTCADEATKVALEQAAEGELEEAALEAAARSRSVEPG